MRGMGSRIFFRTFLIYILDIKIGWVVFEKIWFFFSKFVYKFCENFFSSFGVNSSCSGSHLPSQYGSNPSGGTQTMLILLRPLLKKVYGNESPRAKKARMSKSKFKAMMNVFSDIHRIVYLHWVPEGQTVNQHYYLHVLTELCEK